MLPCPKCKGYMHARRQRGVEIDLCAECEGVWLDEGELARLAGTKRDVPATGEEMTVTRFACPRCGSTLLCQRYSSEHELMIDICGECNGVYLDKGELYKVRAIGECVDTVFTPKRRSRYRGRVRRARALSAVYGTENPVAHHSARERVEFVRKVYGLLILTLIVTAIGSVVGMTRGIALRLFFPALIAEIIVFLIALAVRRKPGINLVVLFVYAFLSGFTIAAVLTIYAAAGLSAVIWQALALTALIFGGLTAYVFITKKDFEWLGGMLFVALIGLLVSGFVLIFTGGAFGHFLWSVIGAVVFCGYILYDTSRIILKYDTTEVVGAVLELYLDIVNLFLDLLRILAYLRR